MNYKTNYFFLENSNYYSYVCEFNQSTISVIPAIIIRDKRGRFIGRKLAFIPLPANLLEAMVGDLLGDGHLRFNKKGVDGLPKPNTNVQFAMTLKSKEYVTYL